MMGWDIAIGIGVSLVVVWLLLIVGLVVVKPDRLGLREAMRLLPDLLRLITRLARDRSLPRGVRVRLTLLGIYLASPIDLIPDFLPLIGYADDAIVVTFVLRGVVRRAGIAAVQRHWPGTDDGFTTLCRLTGLPAPGPAPQASSSDDTDTTGPTER